MLSNYDAGKLSRVPWTAKKSNQSILKEINPEYSLEGLMLKLTLQYFGHWCEELTHWKRLWCWERLWAGEGDDRAWDGWIASATQWTWVWANLERQWRTGKPGIHQFLRSQSQAWLSDWTITTAISFSLSPKCRLNQSVGNSVISTSKVIHLTDSFRCHLPTLRQERWENLLFPCPCAILSIKALHFVQFLGGSFHLWDRTLPNSKITD